MNKILYTAMSFVGIMLTVAFFTISNESKAGIFDDIKDAITGHVIDAKDRLLTDDEFAIGVKKKMSFADWSSDSIHYVNGSVSIIQNDDGQKFVQLNEDFSAGLAPDLYVYLAPGHITSDAQFVNGQKIELGKLTKGSGASFYEINSLLNSYAGEKFSVVIHCKRFNEPMGSYHFN